jgi:recombination protein RecA
VRLDIRKISAVKEGEDVTGGRVRVKVVKNKIAPPFRSAEFDVMFNEGISKLGEIIDIGVDKNIIEKSGAWFSYGGTRIGQGRENVKAFLQEHADMAAEIEAKVRESYGLKAVPAAPAAEAPVKEAKEKEAPVEKEKPAKAGRGK